MSIFLCLIKLTQFAAEYPQALYASISSHHRTAVRCQPRIMGSSAKLMLSHCKRIIQHSRIKPGHWGLVPPVHAIARVKHQSIRRVVVASNHKLKCIIPKIPHSEVTDVQFMVGDNQNPFRPKWFAQLDIVGSSMDDVINLFKLTLIGLNPVVYSLLSTWFGVCGEKPGQSDFLPNWSNDFSRRVRCASTVSSGPSVAWSWLSQGGKVKLTGGAGIKKDRSIEAELQVGEKGECLIWTCKQRGKGRARRERNSYEVRSFGRIILLSFPFHSFPFLSKSPL